MIAENKIDALIVIGQMKKCYIKLLSEITLPVLFVDFYDNRYDVDAVVLPVNIFEAEVCDI